MPITPDLLSTKQEDAILAVLHEPTLEKAAESVGVDEKSLRRWLKDTEFNKSYREARRETFRQAISLTQRYASVRGLPVPLSQFMRKPPHGPEPAHRSAGASSGTGQYPRRPPTMPRVP